MKRRTALSLAAIGAAAPLWSWAEDGYPSKPVRIVVGFPSGTSTDIVARIYAQKLSDHFKRQFIIDNRPGVAGNLGAQVVAKSDPDGYTLFLGTSPNAIGVSLYKNLGFKFNEDLVPIALMASAPTILVVSPRLGVSTVKELIDAAKAPSAALMFGSAGVGTVPHLAGELFNLTTGSHLSHVPYKGNSQGLIDLAEGRLSVIFAPAPTLAGFVKDGRVKALATTSAERSALAPNLPTMAEAGVPNFEASIWYGLLAPKGTPGAIVDALAAVVTRAAESADVKAQLAASGADTLTGGPVEFARFVRQDVQKWAKVVDFGKISPTD